MKPISRRTFLSTSATALAGSSGLSSACGGPDLPDSSAKPNVLIIYTDEHSAWTLGAYGGKVIDTPHMDSIARGGVKFNNFFTNSAVCTPSRGCFITGRYPHAHGAYRNDIELSRNEVTLAHMFQRAGYETGMYGKWHLDGEPRPGWLAPDRSMGFEDCQWMYNRGHWKRIIEKPEGWPENRSVARVGKTQLIAEAPDGRPDIDYDVNAEGQFFTGWLTDKAIEFIQRARNKPFFFKLSIPDPHGPDTVGPPYDTMYRPEDMPVPSTLFQEHMPDWAEQARQAAVKADNAAAWNDSKREEILRRRMTQYYGMVKCLDDNIGRILGTLRESGVLDDTLIIFSSDHGDYMGEHGLYNKNQLYETAHRVSFLARWPAKIKAGSEVNECVSTVDVQPTLLGLIGLEKSGREQGNDASGLITGDPVDWKNEAWIHHSSLERAGVFTPEWEFALVKDHDTILFDRGNDPDQVNNLAYDSRYKKKVEELTGRVIAHNQDVDSPALKWLAG